MIPPKKRKYMNSDITKYKVQYFVNVNPKLNSEKPSLSQMDPQMKKVDYNELCKNQHYFIQGKMYSWGFSNMSKPSKQKEEHNYMKNQQDEEYDIGVDYSEFDLQQSEN